MHITIIATVDEIKLCTVVICIQLIINYSRANSTHSTYKAIQSRVDKNSGGGVMLHLEAQQISTNSMNSAATNQSVNNSGLFNSPKTFGACTLTGAPVKRC